MMMMKVMIPIIIKVSSREQDFERDDDDDICVALDQHFQLDFNSTS